MPIDDSKAGAGKEKTARPIVSPSVAAQIKAAAVTEGVAPEPETQSVQNDVAVYPSIGVYLPEGFQSI